LTISPIRRHPIASYFIVTFTISWALAFSVVSSQLVQGRTISQLDGILMFPAMLVGPSVTGILMTRTFDGRRGLSELFSQMRKWRVGKYAVALLVPPVLILVTLYFLRSFVSPIFVPNVFIFGIGFGVIAGFLEEIGWTGYAFNKLSLRYSALASAILLGAVWGLWHAPVVDFLGAAYPHGQYWLPFYLSFIAIVMAVRVLIVWLYVNTKSVLVAQATHASSTGFLAMLAPAGVTSAQETEWYAVYALLLWILAICIALRFGKNLKLGKPSSS
jgi:uncharacterized protein